MVGSFKVYMGRIGYYLTERIQVFRFCEQNLTEEKIKRRKWNWVGYTLRIQQTLFARQSLKGVVGEVDLRVQGKELKEKHTLPKRIKVQILPNKLFPYKSRHLMKVVTKMKRNLVVA